MSYNRDYLLRMIEMIGDLIAGILGLIKKGEFKKAGDSIDQAYQDYLKEDAAFFRNIRLADLTIELIQQHNYSHGHLEILGELFYAEAELQKAQGHNESSLEYYQKAFKLHQYVIKESASFSLEKEQKTALLQRQIEELNSRLN